MGDMPQTAVRPEQLQVDFKDQALIY
ncbi:hypothetical protein KIPB_015899, partial [Kipferlia bialata]|eukprot:g15899.t1